MSWVLTLLFNILSKLPKFIRERIMPDMLIPPISNNPSKVQLDRLGHFYFEHPDLDQFSKFAEDFGFVVAKRTKDRIFFRGYGKDPYVYVATRSKDNKPRFRGPAFVARSLKEFEKATKLPGATVKSLEYAPGGGNIITFERPDNTFFYIIYGQEEREIGTQEPTATHEQQGPYNRPFEKPRRGERIAVSLTYTFASRL